MMPDYREIKSAESKFIIEYVFYAKKNQSMLKIWARPTSFVVVDVGKQDSISTEV